MLTRETWSDENDTNGQALAAGSPRVPDFDCHAGVRECAASGGPVRTLKRPFTVETGCSFHGRAASFFLTTRSLSYSPVIPLQWVMALNPLEFSRKPLCTYVTTSTLLYQQQGKVLSILREKP